MEVLIVSKTHMGGAACVGGLLLHNLQPVRLLQPGGFWNQPANTDYEIGQVWNLDIQGRRDVTPPHVEDVIVTNREYLRDEHDVGDILLSQVGPWEGSPSILFDSLLCPTSSGNGYASRKTGIPSSSVGFWVADAALVKIDEQRVRYRYTGRSGIYTLPYVGYQLPMEVIPAKTLLRVSLARWWHPSDIPDMEDRCYLQLSGWYV